MFDPHRIGPKRSTSYWRNKGRVIQRKLVDPPGRSLTMSDLEQAKDLLVRNGMIAPTNSGAFGRVRSYKVFANGVDVTDNPAMVINSIDPSIPESITFGVGTYMMVMPNYSFSGDNGKYLLVKGLGFGQEETLKFRGLPDETYIYQTSGNDVQPEDYIQLEGSYGIVVDAIVFRWYWPSTQSSYNVIDNSVAFRM